MSTIFRIQEVLENQENAPSDIIHFGHKSTIISNNMLLLTNCEVHTGKYSDRGFEVRTERKAEVRMFSRMDRTNWSVRALLYSHSQRPKPSLNSVLNIFVSSLNAAVGREIFSSSNITFKVKLSTKKSKTCVKVFVIPFVFVC